MFTLFAGCLSSLAIIGSSLIHIIKKYIIQCYIGSSTDFWLTTDRRTKKPSRLENGLSNFTYFPLFGPCLDRWNEIIRQKLFQIKRFSLIWSYRLLHKKLLKEMRTIDIDLSKRWLFYFTALLLGFGLIYAETIR